jgi:hypothetical protein
MIWTARYFDRMFASREKCFSLDFARNTNEFSTWVFQLSAWFPMYRRFNGVLKTVGMYPETEKTVAHRPVKLK